MDNELREKFNLLLDRLCSEKVVGKVILSYEDLSDLKMEIYNSEYE